MKRISNYDKNKEKAKNHKEMLLNKKEEKINKMSDNEIINELKRKNLPVYGTKLERIDRLKKKEGIINEINNSKIQKDNVLNKIEKIKNKREERRAVYEKKVFL